jgi:hypothetical protein
MATAGRKKNDGRGKTGGRQMGVQNKNKTLKAILAEHSLAYFTPSIETKNRDGEDILVSQFDRDVSQLDPKDRVKAEADILRYHTPMMQATSVDMAVADRNRPLTEWLQAKIDGDNAPPKESE